MPRTLILRLALLGWLLSLPRYPALAQVAGAPPAETKEFTFDRDSYKYSFHSGDPCIVIVWSLQLFSDPDLNQRVLEDGDVFKPCRFVRCRKRVTAERLNSKNGAIEIRYVDGGTEFHGWVDGFGLKPVDYQGKPPHEEGLEVVGVILGAVVVAILIGAAILGGIYFLFGRQALATLLVLPALGCFCLAFFWMCTGAWPVALGLVIVAAGLLIAARWIRGTGGQPKT